MGNDSGFAVYTFSLFTGPFALTEEKKNIAQAAVSNIPSDVSVVDSLTHNDPWMIEPPVPKRKFPRRIASVVFLLVITATTFILTDALIKRNTEIRSQAGVDSGMPGSGLPAPKSVPKPAPPVPKPPTGGRTELISKPVVVVPPAATKVSPCGAAGCKSTKVEIGPAGRLYVMGNDDLYHDVSGYGAEGLAGLDTSRVAEVWGENKVVSKTTGTTATQWVERANTLASEDRAIFNIELGGRETQLADLQKIPAASLTEYQKLLLEQLKAEISGLKQQEPQKFGITAAAYIGLEGAGTGITPSLTALQDPNVQYAVQVYADVVNDPTASFSDRSLVLADIQKNTQFTADQVKTLNVLNNNYNKAANDYVTRMGNLTGRSGAGTVDSVIKDIAKTYTLDWTQLKGALTSDTNISEAVKKQQYYTQNVVSAQETLTRAQQALDDLDLQQVGSSYAPTTAKARSDIVAALENAKKAYVSAMKAYDPTQTDDKKILDTFAKVYEGQQTDRLTQIADLLKKEKASEATWNAISTTLNSPEAVKARESLGRCTVSGCPNAALIDTYQANLAKQIQDRATALGVSPQAVQAEVASAVAKIGLKNQADLAVDTYNRDALIAEEARLNPYNDARDKIPKIQTSQTSLNEAAQLVQRASVGTLNEVTLDKAKATLQTKFQDWFSAEMKKQAEFNVGKEMLTAGKEIGEPLLVRGGNEIMSKYPDLNKQYQMELQKSALQQSWVEGKTSQSKLVRGGYVSETVVELGSIEAELQKLDPTGKALVDAKIMFEKPWDTEKLENEYFNTRDALVNCTGGGNCASALLAFDAVKNHPFMQNTARVVDSAGELLAITTVGEISLKKYDIQSSIINPLQPVEKKALVLTTRLGNQELAAELAQEMDILSKTNPNYKGMTGKDIVTLLNNRIKVGEELATGYFSDYRNLAALIRIAPTLENGAKGEQMAGITNGFNTKLLADLRSGAVSPVAYEQAMGKVGVGTQLYYGFNSLPLFEGNLEQGSLVMQNAAAKVRDEYAASNNVYLQTIAKNDTAVGVAVVLEVGARSLQAVGNLGRNTIAGVAEGLFGKAAGNTVDSALGTFQKYNDLPRDITALFGSPESLVAYDQHVANVEQYGNGLVAASSAPLAVGSLVALPFGGVVVYGGALTGGSLVNIAGITYGGFMTAQTAGGTAIACSQGNSTACRQGSGNTLFMATTTGLGILSGALQAGQVSAEMGITSMVANDANNVPGILGKVQKSVSAMNNLPLTNKIGIANRMVAASGVPIFGSQAVSSFRNSDTTNGMLQLGMALATGMRAFIPSSLTSAKINPAEVVDIIGDGGQAVMECLGGGTMCGQSLAALAIDVGQLGGGPGGGINSRGNETVAKEFAANQMRVTLSSDPKIQAAALESLQGSMRDLAAVEAQIGGLNKVQPVRPDSLSGTALKEAQIAMQKASTAFFESSYSIDLQTNARIYDLAVTNLRDTALVVARENVALGKAPGAGLFGGALGKDPLVAAFDNAKGKFETVIESGKGPQDAEYVLARDAALDARNSLVKDSQKVPVSALYREVKAIAGQSQSQLDLSRRVTIAENLGKVTSAEGLVKSYDTALVQKVVEDSILKEAVSSQDLARRIVDESNKFNGGRVGESGIDYPTARVIADEAWTRTNPNDTGVVAKQTLASVDGAVDAFHTALLKEVNPQGGNTADAEAIKSLFDDAGKIKNTGVKDRITNAVAETLSGVTEGYKQAMAEILVDGFSRQAATDERIGKLVEDIQNKTEIGKTLYTTPDTVRSLADGFGKFQGEVGGVEVTLTRLQDQRAAAEAELAQVETLNKTIAELEASLAKATVEEERVNLTNQLEQAMSQLQPVTDRIPTLTETINISKSRETGLQQQINALQQARDAYQKTIAGRLASARQSAGVAVSNVGRSIFGTVGKPTAVGTLAKSLGVTLPEVPHRFENLIRANETANLGARPDVLESVKTTINGVEGTKWRLKESVTTDRVVQEDIRAFNKLMDDFESVRGYPQYQNQVQKYLRKESLLQLEAGGGKTKVIGPMLAAIEKRTIFGLPTISDAKTYVNDMIQIRAFFDNQGIDMYYFDSAKGFLEIPKSGEFDPAKATGVSLETVRKSAELAASDPQKRGLMVIGEAQHIGWGEIQGRTADGSLQSQMLREMLLGKGKSYTLVIDEIGAIAGQHLSVSKGAEAVLNKLEQGNKNLHGYETGDALLKASAAVRDMQSLGKLRSSVENLVRQGKSQEELLFTFKDANETRTSRPYPADMKLINDSYGELLDGVIAKTPDGTPIKTEMEIVRESLRNATTEADIETSRKKFEELVNSSSADNAANRTALMDLSYRVSDLQARWYTLSKTPGVDFGLEVAQSQNRTRWEAEIANLERRRLEVANRRDVSSQDLVRQIDADIALNKLKITQDLNNGTYEMVLQKQQGTTGETYQQTAQKIALQEEGLQMLRAAPGGEAEIAGKIGEGTIRGVSELTITPDSDQLSMRDLLRTKAAEGKLKGYDATPDSASNAIGVSATGFSEEPPIPDIFVSASDMATLVKQGAAEWQKQWNGKIPAFVIADDGVSYKVTTDALVKNFGNVEYISRTKYKTDLHGGVETEYFIDKVVRNPDGTIRLDNVEKPLTEADWSNKTQDYMKNQGDKLMIIYEGRTRAVDFAVSALNENTRWTTIGNDMTNMETGTQSYKRNRVAAYSAEELQRLGWESAKTDPQDKIADITDRKAEASKYGLWMRTSDPSIKDGKSAVAHMETVLREQLAQTRFESAVRDMVSSPQKTLRDLRDQMISQKPTQADSVKKAFEPLLLDADRFERTQTMEIQTKPLTGEQIPAEVYSRGLQSQQQLEASLTSLQKTLRLSNAELSGLKKTLGIDKPFISQQEFFVAYQNETKPEVGGIGQGPRDVALAWANTNSPKTLPTSAWQNQSPLGELVYQEQAAAQAAVQAPQPGQQGIGQPAPVILKDVVAQLNSGASIADIGRVKAGNAFRTLLPFTQIPQLQRELTDLKTNSQTVSQQQIAALPSLFERAILPSAADNDVVYIGGTPITISEPVVIYRMDSGRPFVEKNPTNPGAVYAIVPTSKAPTTLTTQSVRDAAIAEGTGRDIKVDKGGALQKQIDNLQVEIVAKTNEIAATQTLMGQEGFTLDPASTDNNANNVYNALAEVIQKNIASSLDLEIKKLDPAITIKSDDISMPLVNAVVAHEQAVAEAVKADANADPKTLKTYTTLTNEINSFIDERNRLVENNTLPDDQTIVLIQDEVDQLLTALTAPILAEIASQAPAVAQAGQAPQQIAPKNPVTEALSGIAKMVEDAMKGPATDIPENVKNIAQNAADNLGMMREKLGDNQKDLLQQIDSTLKQIAALPAQPVQQPAATPVTPPIISILESGKDKNGRFVKLLVDGKEQTEKEGKTSLTGGFILEFKKDTANPAFWNIEITNPISGTLFTPITLFVPMTPTEAKEYIQTIFTQDTDVNIARGHLFEAISTGRMTIGQAKQIVINNNLITRLKNPNGIDKTVLINGDTTKNIQGLDQLWGALPTRDLTNTIEKADVKQILLYHIRNDRTASQNYKIYQNLVKEKEQLDKELTALSTQVPSNKTRQRETQIVDRLGVIDVQLKDLGLKKDIDQRLIALFAERSWKLGFDLSQDLDELGTGYPDEYTALRDEVYTSIEKEMQTSQLNFWERGLAGLGSLLGRAGNFLVKNIGNPVLNGIKNLGTFLGSRFKDTWNVVKARFDSWSPSYPSWVEYAAVGVIATVGLTFTLFTGGFPIIRGLLTQVGILLTYAVQAIGSFFTSLITTVGNISSWFGVHVFGPIGGVLTFVRDYLATLPAGQVLTVVGIGVGAVAAIGILYVIIWKIIPWIFRILTKLWGGVTGLYNLLWTGDTGFPAILNATPFHNTGRWCLSRLFPLFWFYDLFRFVIWLPVSILKIPFNIVNWFRKPPATGATDKGFLKKGWQKRLLGIIVVGGLIYGLVVGFKTIAPHIPSIGGIPFFGNQTQTSEVVETGQAEVEQPVDVSQVELAQTDENIASTELMDIQGFEKVEGSRYGHIVNIREEQFSRPLKNGDLFIFFDTSDDGITALTYGVVALDGNGQPTIGVYRSDVYSDLLSFGKEYFIETLPIDSYFTYGTTGMQVNSETIYFSLYRALESGAESQPSSKLSESAEQQALLPRETVIVSVDGRKETRLDQIAVAVFAESSNGLDDEAAQRLMAWVAINDALAPQALFQEGISSFKALQTLEQSLFGGVYDENSVYTTGAIVAAEQLLAVDASGNPYVSPGQHDRMTKTMELVQRVYAERLAGLPDPTQGSTYFAKYQIRTPDEVSKMPDVLAWYGPFQQQHVVDGNISSGSIMILATGKEGCVWSGSCPVDKARKSPSKPYSIGQLQAGAQSLQQPTSAVTSVQSGDVSVQQNMQQALALFQGTPLAQYLPTQITIDKREVGSLGTDIVGEMISTKHLPDGSITSEIALTDQYVTGGHFSPQRLQGSLADKNITMSESEITASLVEDPAVGALVHEIMHGVVKWNDGQETSPAFEAFQQIFYVGKSDALAVTHYANTYPSSDTNTYVTRQYEDFSDVMTLYKIAPSILKLLDHLKYQFADLLFNGMPVSQIQRALTEQSSLQKTPVTFASELWGQLGGAVMSMFVAGKNFLNPQPSEEPAKPPTTTTSPTPPNVISSWTLKTTNPTEFNRLFSSARESLDSANISENKGHYVQTIYVKRRVGPSDQWVQFTFIKPKTRGGIGWASIDPTMLQTEIGQMRTPNLYQDGNQYPVISLPTIGIEQNDNTFRKVTLPEALKQEQTILKEKQPEQPEMTSAESVVASLRDEQIQEANLLYGQLFNAMYRDDLNTVFNRLITILVNYGDVVTPEELQNTEDAVAAYIEGRIEQARIDVVIHKNLTTMVGYGIARFQALTDNRGASMVEKLVTFQKTLASIPPPEEPQAPVFEERRQPQTPFGSERSRTTSQGIGEVETIPPTFFRRILDAARSFWARFTSEEGQRGSLNLKPFMDWLAVVTGQRQEQPQTDLKTINSNNTIEIANRAMPIAQEFITSYLEESVKAGLSTKIVEQNTTKYTVKNYLIFNIPQFTVQFAQYLAQQTQSLRYILQTLVDTIQGRSLDQKMHPSQQQILLNQLLNPENKIFFDTNHNPASFEAYLQSIYGKIADIHIESSPIDDKIRRYVAEEVITNATANKQVRDELLALPTQELLDKIQQSPSLQREYLNGIDIVHIVIQVGNTKIRIPIMVTNLGVRSSFVLSTQLSGVATQLSGIAMKKTIDGETYHMLFVGDGFDSQGLVDGLAFIAHEVDHTVTSVYQERFLVQPTLTEEEKYIESILDEMGAELAQSRFLTTLADGIDRNGDQQLAAKIRLLDIEHQLERQSTIDTRDKYYSIGVMLGRALQKQFGDETLITFLHTSPIKSKIDAVSAAVGIAEAQIIQEKPVADSFLKKLRERGIVIEERRQPQTPSQGIEVFNPNDLPKKVKDALRSITLNSDDIRTVTVSMQADGMKDYAITMGNGFQIGFDENGEAFGGGVSAPQPAGNPALIALQTRLQELQDQLALVEKNLETITNLTYASWARKEAVDAWADAWEEVLRRYPNVTPNQDLLTKLGAALRAETEADIRGAIIVLNDITRRIAAGLQAPKPLPAEEPKKAEPKAPAEPAKPVEEAVPATLLPEAQPAAASVEPPVAVKPARETPVSQAEKTSEPAAEQEKKAAEELAGLKSQLAEVNTALLVSQKALSEANTAKKQGDEQRAKLESDLVVLTQQNESLQTQITTLTGESITQTDAVKNLRNQLTKSQTTQTNLKKKIAQLNTDNTKLTNDLTEKQEELITLKSQFEGEQKKVRDLETQAVVDEQTLGEQQQALSATQTEVTRLTEVLTSATQTQETVTNQLNEQTKVLESALSEAQTAKDAQTVLASQFAEAQRQLDALKTSTLDEEAEARRQALINEVLASDEGPTLVAESLRVLTPSEVDNILKGVTATEFQARTNALAALRNTIERRAQELSNEASTLGEADKWALIADVLQNDTGATIIERTLTPTFAAETINALAQTVSEVRMQELNRLKNDIINRLLDPLDQILTNLSQTISDADKKTFRGVLLTAINQVRGNARVQQNLKSYVNSGNISDAVHVLTVRLRAVLPEQYTWIYDEPALLEYVLGQVVAEKVTVPRTQAQRRQPTQPSAPKTTKPAVEVIPLSDEKIPQEIVTNTGFADLSASLQTVATQAISETRSAVRNMEQFARLPSQAQVTVIQTGIRSRFPLESSGMDKTAYDNAITEASIMLYAAMTTQKDYRGTLPQGLKTLLQGKTQFLNRLFRPKCGAFLIQKIFAADGGAACGQAPAWISALDELTNPPILTIIKLISGEMSSYLARVRGLTKFSLVKREAIGVRTEQEAFVPELLVPATISYTLNKFLVDSIDAFMEVNPTTHKDLITSLNTDSFRQFMDLMLGVLTPEDRKESEKLVNALTNITVNVPPSDWTSDMTMDVVAMMNDLEKGISNEGPLSTQLETIGTASQEERPVQMQTLLQTLSDNTSERLDAERVADILLGTTVSQQSLVSGVFDTAVSDGVISRTQLEDNQSFINEIKNGLTELPHVVGAFQTTPYTGSPTDMNAIVTWMKAVVDKARIESEMQKYRDFQTELQKKQDKLEATSVQTQEVIQQLELNKAILESVRERMVEAERAAVEGIPFQLPAGEIPLAVPLLTERAQSIVASEEQAQKAEAQRQEITFLHQELSDAALVVSFDGLLAFHYRQGMNDDALVEEIHRLIQETNTDTIEKLSLLIGQTEVDTAINHLVNQTFEDIFWSTTVAPLLTDIPADERNAFILSYSRDSWRSIGNQLNEIIDSTLSDRGDARLQILSTSSSRSDVENYFRPRIENVFMKLRNSVQNSAITDILTTTTIEDFSREFIEKEVVRMTQRLERTINRISTIESDGNRYPNGGREKQFQAVNDMLSTLNKNKDYKTLIAIAQEFKSLLQLRESTSEILTSNLPIVVEQPWWKRVFVSKNIILGLLAIPVLPFVATIGFVGWFYAVNFMPTPTLPLRTVTPITYTYQGAQQESTETVPTFQIPTEEATVQTEGRNELPSQEPQVFEPTSTLSQQELETTQIQKEFNEAPSYISYILKGFFDNFIKPMRREHLSDPVAQARLFGRHLEANEIEVLVNSPILHVVNLGGDLGEEGDFNQIRTDIILDTYINLETGKITTVSLPRDLLGARGYDSVNKLGDLINTWAGTYFQGVGLTNDQFSKKNAPLENVQARYEAATGVPVDVVNIINFDGFKKLVDTLYPNGMKIKVPFEFYISDGGAPIGYGSHDPGTYTMTGTDVLAFVRTRQIEEQEGVAKVPVGGPIGRMQHVDLFIKTLIKDQINQLPQKFIDNGLNIDGVLDVYVKVFEKVGKDMLSNVPWVDKQPNSGVVYDILFREESVRRTVGLQAFIEKLLNTVNSIHLNAVIIAPNSPQSPQELKQQKNENIYKVLQPFGSSKYVTPSFDSQSCTNPKCKGSWFLSESDPDIGNNPDKMRSVIDYYQEIRKIIHENLPIGESTALRDIFTGGGVNMLPVVTQSQWWSRIVGGIISQLQTLRERLTAPQGLTESKVALTEALLFSRIISSQTIKQIDTAEYTQLYNIALAEVQKVNVSNQQSHLVQTGYIRRAIGSNQWVQFTFIRPKGKSKITNNYASWLYVAENQKEETIQSVKMEYIDASNNPYSVTELPAFAIEENRGSYIRTTLPEIAQKAQPSQDQTFEKGQTVSQLPSNSLLDRAGEMWTKFVEFLNNSKSEQESTRNQNEDNAEKPLNMLTPLLRVPVRADVDREASAFHEAFLDIGFDEGRYRLLTKYPI